MFLIKLMQEHHYIGGYQGNTYSLDYHVTLPYASDVSDQARARNTTTLEDIKLLLLLAA
jgi:hypothetical protein